MSKNAILANLSTIKTLLLAIGKPTSIVWEYGTILYVDSGRVQVSHMDSRAYQNYGVCVHFLSLICLYFVFLPSSTSGLLTCVRQYVDCVFRVGGISSSSKIQYPGTFILLPHVQLDVYEVLPPAMFRTCRGHRCRPSPPTPMYAFIVYRAWGSEVDNYHCSSIFICIGLLTLSGSPLTVNLFASKHPYERVRTRGDSNP